jgi:alkyl hydroperoxide reductase subunit AhpC
VTLRINDIAPNFTADTTDGTLDFHEWVGSSYAVLFSHPKDFTPVCTTEFGAVARLAGEFAARNTKVMGVSIDSVEDHQKWKKDIESVGGAPANFPIIDDSSLKVAKLYGMLPADAYLPDGRTANDSATVRTTFIVGPEKKVRLMLIYPMTVGRNFDEILRVLDAIQATDRFPVATPADWQVGEKVIVRTNVSTDDARAQFGDVEVVLPYLRKTSLPG